MSEIPKWVKKMVDSYFDGNPKVKVCWNYNIKDKEVEDPDACLKCESSKYCEFHNLELETCSLCDNLAPIQVMRITYDDYDDKLWVCPDCFEMLPDIMKERADNEDALSDAFLKSYRESDL